MAAGVLAGGCQPATGWACCLSGGPGSACAVPACSAASQQLLRSSCSRRALLRAARQCGWLCRASTEARLRPLGPRAAAPPGGGCCGLSGRAAAAPSAAAAAAAAARAERRCAGLSGCAAAAAAAAAARPRRRRRDCGRAEQCQHSRRGGLRPRRCCCETRAPGSGQSGRATEAEKSRAGGPWPAARPAVRARGQARPRVGSRLQTPRRHHHPEAECEVSDPPGGGAQGKAWRERDGR